MSYEELLEIADKVSRTLHEDNPMGWMATEPLIEDGEVSFLIKPYGEEVIVSFRPNGGHRE